MLPAPSFWPLPLRRYCLAFPLSPAGKPQILGACLSPKRRYATQQGSTIHTTDAVEIELHCVMQAKFVIIKFRLAHQVLISAQRSKKREVG